MAIIQIKRGTSADWSVSNPILALAELGLETDTNQMKAGDGKTAWSALPYLAESVTRVESVNGETGVVELTKYDIPLHPHRVENSSIIAGKRNQALSNCYIHD